MRLQRNLLTLAVTACFGTPFAYANPVGPAVVSGQATFLTQGGLLSVTNTPGAIINWQQFSIQANEATRFIQQSAASSVLNRVVGVDPSLILGTLQSNGRVFLINPNGILFGAGARIDVAGLVASSLNLRNEDFLAGRMNFGGDAAAASAVVNQGRITAASGGRVYLVGGAVDNQGTISAPNGDVVLAAGKSVRVTEGSTPGLQVEIIAPADRPLNLSEVTYGSRGIYAGLARTGGTISADSAVRGADGRITLQASGDVTLASGSVVTANGANGGKVSIVAGGTASVSGTVEARGESGTGGRITVVGERTGIFDGARVDASGAGGGGTILIGGDKHGGAIADGAAALPNSRRTYVGADAMLRADAIESGNGGKVVVWADDTTQYYGSISTRGGATGGDGGFVEVSGKSQLDLRGKIDVAAPLGAGGKVLLDPQDIVLNATVQPSPPNNANGTPDVASADPPAAGVYTIQIADVTGYSELFLQATRDITVASAVAMTSGNRVRFEAGNNIGINAALSASGGITLTGSSITSTTAGTLTSTGGANANAGNVTLNATGNVNLAGNIVASGGASTGSNPGRNGGSISITGAGIALGAATLTANGSNAIGAASQVGGAGGAISLTSTNGVTGTGAVTASGGNGIVGPAAGGAGGSITIANSGAGNISVGTLTARAGNAVTTGAGGAAGSVSVTNTAAAGSLGTGAIVTTGGNNANGGTVSLTSAGALSAGAITTSGGTALAGTSGRNAGNVTLSAGGAITALGIVTSSGTAGVLAGDRAGGNGAAVSITGVGGIAAVAMTASGGAAAGTNAAGGNAGSITLNNSGSGNITTGALAAQTGAALGTGAGGTAGSISVSNTAAAGNLTTAGITTTGGTKGHGGNVSLSALGALSTGAGNINSAGGTTITGNAGRNAGTVTLSGDSIATQGITANGTNGIGANSAGGAGGNVSVTGTGNAVSVAAITTNGGAGVAGVAAGGNAGTITLDAGATTPSITLGGNLTATGGAGVGGAAGGNAGDIRLKDPALLNAAAVTVDASGGAGAPVGTGGSVQFDATVDSTGGARALTVNTGGATTFTGAVGGNSALASLTTNAGGTTSLAANVTTTGAQSYGDNVTLAGAVTAASTGNNAITFSGTVNGGQALAVNTTGTTTFTGAVGGGTALASLTTNAGGTTAINGGAVTTTGTQDYGDNVTLGANTTLASTAGGDVTIGGTLNSTGASRTLAVNSSGTTTFGGIVGGTLALTSLTTNAAGTTAINTAGITTTGAQVYGDAVTLGADTTLNAGVGNITFSNTVNGAFALTANSTGTTTFTGAAGNTTPLAALTTNVGGSTLINGGSIATTGDQTYGDSATTGGATSLTASAGALTATGTVTATAGTLTLAADATRNISFANAANNFGTARITSGNNVTLADVNALILGASTVSGNLSVTTGGPITQSAALGVTGTSGFSAGANAITLAQANDFVGAVSVNNSGANNVSIVDSNALVLGTSAVGSGTLGITAGGTISQTGAITQAAAAGATTVTLTAAGSDVLLNTQANNLNGAIAFGGTLANVRDVGLRNTNAGATLPTNLTALANLRNLTIQFDNRGVALPGLTLQPSGSLSVTAGGAIMQTGALTVPGTSSFSAGANGITLTMANDFTGAVSLNNSGANNVAVTDGTALTLGPSNVGGSLTARAGGNLTLSGNLDAGGAGDSIVLAAGGNFDNSSSFAMNPGAGRWLVWSADPASDNRGGLAYNFKQYNATYGVTAVAGAGNGFLYSLAPVITPSLVAPVSKVYDGTTTATLVPGNYAAGGAVDGDTVTLNNPAAGSYDTRNVGVNKNVSVTGIALVSATNAAATVYGYQLASTSANANVGTITFGNGTLTAGGPSPATASIGSAFLGAQFAGMLRLDFGDLLWMPDCDGAGGNPAASKCGGAALSEIPPSRN